jgi:hypothetical protein
MLEGLEFPIPAIPPGILWPHLCVPSSSSA